MTDLEMRAIALREQAQESLRRCILLNEKTFDRLAETGQPLDDDDRLFIRKALLLAVGDAKMGDL